MTVHQSSRKFTPFAWHRVNCAKAQTIPRRGGCYAMFVKVKVGRRYGEWLMREARLIRRLKPRHNKMLGKGTGPRVKGYVLPWLRKKPAA